NGDLANWRVPSTGVGGIGGAVGLAAGAARVIALLFHRPRAGGAELRGRCPYPLPPPRCGRAGVTGLPLLAVDRCGFLLRGLAPGVSIDDVRGVTAASLRVAADVREMEF